MDDRKNLPEPASSETREVGTQRGFGFETALANLKQGRAVTRRGWNGAGQYIKMQVPDDNSKMSLPYLYIRTVQGTLVPWLASQTDLLANDWTVQEIAG